MNARAESLGSSSMPFGSERPSRYVASHHLSEASASGVTSSLASSSLPPRDATIVFITHMPPQPVCFTGHTSGCSASPAALILRAWSAHSAYVLGGAEMLAAVIIFLL